MGIVLRHTLPPGVHHPQVELGETMVLFRRLEVPFNGLGVVRRGPAAVAEPKPELHIGVPMIDRHRDGFHFRHR